MNTFPLTPLEFAYAALQHVNIMSLAETVKEAKPKKTLTNQKEQINTNPAAPALTVITSWQMNPEKRPI